MSNRQAKLTPEVQEQIVSSLRLGNYIETAAGLAGVHSETMRLWLKRGAKGDGAEYVAFRAAVLEAQAYAEHATVDLIMQAAREDWRAGAWRLERSNPRRWGNRVRVEVANELGAVLGKIRDRLSPEAYEQVLAAIADGESGEGGASGALSGEGGDAAVTVADLAAAEDGEGDVED